MIRVLLADDHAVVRKGLREILTEEFPDITIDEASTGQETFHKVQKKEYELVILDIKMPGRSGLDVLGDIKAICPKTKVLMLSMFPEKEYAIQALRGGAIGYLVKDSDLTELIEATRTALSGKRYVGREFGRELAEMVAKGKEEVAHTSLSNREFEILCMIGAGKKPKAIAEELYLGQSTVYTYRLRILKKLRLKTDTELVRYVLEHKLLG